MMKRFMLLAFVLLLVSNLVFAQDPEPGSIDIFADLAMTSCNIYDATGLATLHIFHTNALEVGSSIWKLELTGGAENLVFIGQILQFPLVIGDVFTGISVSYQACLSNSFQLMTLNFQALDPSPPCGLFSIVPSDDVPTHVEIVDCNLRRMEIPRGGQARLNPDGTCLCEVPVAETSWGGIKALYK
jgi:hypothetical protein